MKDKIYRDRVLIESKDSPGYSDFTTGGSTMGEHYQLVYMYDIKNTEEVLAGEYPRFDIKGPYGYRMANKKINVSFYEGDEDLMINYYAQVACEFNQERTGEGLRPDDSFTTVNPIFWTAERIFRHVNPMHATFQKCARQHNATMFVTKTVHELLFGYDDPFANCVTGLPRFPGLLSNLSEAESLNAAQNRTIYSGRDQPDKMWSFSSFGNQKYVSGYAIPAKVSGTDGASFPINQRDRQKEDGVNVFAPQLKHTTHFDFTDTFDYHGITLWRFTQSMHSTSNVDDNPDLFKYYAFGYPGAMDISFVNQVGWQVSPPVFISKPLFYQADHYYDAIGGEASGIPKPTAEVSESVMGMEPTVGKVMHVRQGLQINMMLNYNTNGIFRDASQKYAVNDMSRYDIDGNCIWTGLCGNLSESMLMPVMYTISTGDLTDDGVRYVTKVLNYQKLIEVDLSFFGPMLGLLSLGIGITILVADKQRKYRWIGWQLRDQENMSQREQRNMNHQQQSANKACSPSKPMLREPLLPEDKDKTCKV